MDEKVKEAIDILKEEDKIYIENIIKANIFRLNYDEEYAGWFIGNDTIIDYLFDEENTYLNPRELEGTIEEIIENKIYPINEVAKEFISYYESKWGLDNISEDNIRSNINKDCDFKIFENRGLSDEVIKELKNQNIKIEEC